MQDRWVAYIYRYRAGVRSENIGFIKAQKISTHTKENVRFQIGLKLYKENPCKCMVYLIDGENIYKIKDFYISAHDHDTMMLRFEIPWWSPVGLDKAVTDYKGLYFMCEDGENCACLWKDEADAFHVSYSEAVEYTQVMGVSEAGNRYVPASEIKEWKPKPLTRSIDAAPVVAKPEQAGLPTDYQSMLDLYPKLPLFSNSRLLNCVKIMPQDIGRLPIANWKFGTNSFVTHGFYHYQYLMLGNVILEQGERLVLGIPGVYTNKEKYVANMFGFAKFVPAQQCDYMTGRFGYWVSEIVTE